MLEMTLVGIPLMFVLISTVEMARGMWIYHTLAYAVREGTRYTIVHGVNCGITGNNCQGSATNGRIAVKDIASVIQNAAVGLYQYGSPTDTCPSTTVLCIRMQSLTDDTGWITMNSALTNANRFPTDGGDAISAPITITVTYPFQSAIAMFWPGAGPGMNFTNVTFPASSRENVQF